MATRNGNMKRKNFALYGEIRLEKDMEISQNKLRSE
jgi:hypothetical protein